MPLTEHTVKHASQLMAAVETLVETVPTTFAGLAAKARAAWLIGEIANDKVASSLARDVGVVAGELSHHEAQAPA